MSTLTTTKTRYAAVGTGGRIPMFIDPLVRDYPDKAELVALCDASLTRATYHQERLQSAYGYAEVPTFKADDFDRMIEETKPDVVIVCTIDATHHEYIIRALHAGCDVVTEKPMTTDDEKCRAIFKAVEETGRSVRVTFNMRWTPGIGKVRSVLQSGAIGTVHAVNLEYQLNTSHGADYFRRWHAHKEHSGGLLIHKSTHHFDMVNWVLDAIPSEVFAWGGLNFYGREAALRRGDDKYTGYDRYTGEAAAEDDPFALTLNDDALRGLYQNAEAESGYVRDRNVFRDGISIEDTMSLLVKYRSGVVLNYSLVAFSPQEGYRITFTGDRGRLEYTETHATHIIAGHSDKELAEEQSGHTQHLRLIPMFGAGEDIPVPTAEGGHGGGDPLLQGRIFASTGEPDPFSRDAGHEQGAASLLIGVAANHSMRTGLPVVINDLCQLPADAIRLTELI